MYIATLSVYLVPDEGAIKLVGGRNASEGRVDIYLQGQWGTVCGDHWDIRHATVVCSQLGYLDAISVEKSSKFGQGNGSIHLQNIHCLGNEAVLTDCSAWQVNESHCDHSKDVGVICNPNHCPSSMQKL